VAIWCVYGGLINERFRDELRQVVQVLLSVRDRPDEIGCGRLPVDSAAVEEAGGLDDLAYGSPVDVSRYRHTSQIWTLEARAATAQGFVGWAFYTYLELTADEEHAVSTGRLDAQAVARLATS
jgi:hypothetical protein